MKNNLLKNENIAAEDVNNNDEVLFDINLLSDSTFKRLVKYYDSTSGSPTEYLVTATLASLSGAIGKQAFIEVTEYITVFSNIYAMLIGKSTIGRKSTALNIATNKLQKIDDQKRYLYEKDLRDYELKISELKIAKENKEVYELQPPKRDYLMFPQDSTVEALTDILSRSTRGLLVHNEIGGWLAAMNKGYSGDSKMFFTNIYDVPVSYEVNRIVKGSTYLHRPYLSILGASTIDWILENSTDSDITSGFFARFIYSIINRPTKSYYALLELQDLNSNKDNILDVYSMYKRLSELEQTQIEITKEARAYHINWDIESYKELLNSENDNELSFKSRLIIYSLKFAMIICLTDGRILIELKDIKDGIVLAEYYKRNVEILLTRELNRTEFTAKEEKVLSFIKRAGEIERSDLLIKTRVKAKELDEIVLNLAEKNLIVELATQKGKRRPLKRYKTIDD